MVLGGGADHGRSADVDVLDAFLERGALRDGRLERIEVHHQQIDRLDAVLLHRSGVLFVGADRQQPAMHFRMQRLDPAIHHFGEAGQLGDVDHLQPGIFQRLGRAAGRNEFDAVAGKRLGEIHQSGLVGYRQQSAGDAARVAGHDLRASTRNGRKCIRRDCGIHKHHSGNSGSSARSGRTPGGAGGV